MASYTFRRSHPGLSFQSLHALGSHVSLAQGRRTLLNRVVWALSWVTTESLWPSLEWTQPVSRYDPDFPTVKCHETFQPASDYKVLF